MNPIQTRIEAADLDSTVSRRFYLPRLDPKFYRAHAVVHWSLTMHDQAIGWLSEKFHASFRELALHTAAREMVASPVYCLMPDHMHLIWMGLHPDSDQRRGMAFFRTHLKKVLHPARLQHQAHDHVLREDERTQQAFTNACNYILQNPVEKGLVEHAEDWKYFGCVVPGYPNLSPVDDNFWEVFWRVYWKQRQEFEI